MTSKPLDIDGCEMKVGDLVVAAYEGLNKGQYRTIRGFVFGSFVHRTTGEMIYSTWHYRADDHRLYICNRSRIIRDTKSKENIDLAEWVGEREEVK